MVIGYRPLFPLLQLLSVPGEQAGVSSPHISRDTARFGCFGGNLLAKPTL